MLVLQMIVILLSLVLFGAHYLRSHNVGMLVAIAAVMALLLVQQPWAARVVEATLTLAVFEWCRTLHRITQRRRLIGQPVVRMSIILGAVTAITVLAVAALESPPMRHFYRLG